MGLLAGTADEQFEEVAQVTIELHDFNGMVTVADADAIESRLTGLGFHRIQLSQTNRENVLYFQPQRFGIGPMAEVWARVVTPNTIGLKRVCSRAFS
ncbi:MAG: hypothetical protein JWQ43_2622 [Glaciihabitans sp.]|nr:hypothetical protein [Glaciihabitans sp.]